VTDISDEEMNKDVSFKSAAVKNNNKKRKTQLDKALLGPVTDTVISLYQIPDNRRKIVTVQ
jgi:hypothetical protein